MHTQARGAQKTALGRLKWETRTQAASCCNQKYRTCISDGTLIRPWYPGRSVSFRQTTASVACVKNKGDGGACGPGPFLALFAPSQLFAHLLAPAGIFGREACLSLGTLALQTVASPLVLRFFSPVFFCFRGQRDGGTSTMLNTPAKFFGEMGDNVTTRFLAQSSRLGW